MCRNRCLHNGVDRCLYPREGCKPLPNKRKGHRLGYTPVSDDPDNIMNYVPNVLRDKEARND